jgi:hypothetical protein
MTMAKTFGDVLFSAFAAMLACASFFDAARVHEKALQVKPRPTELPLS